MVSASLNISRCPGIFCCIEPKPDSAEEGEEKEKILSKFFVKPWFQAWVDMPRDACEIENQRIPGTLEGIAAR